MIKKKLIIFIVLIVILSSMSYSLFKKTVFQNNLFPNHVIDIEYDKEVEVKGMSMFPTFSSGNLVLLREYDNEELSEGQIICYRNQENTACHRIISIYKDKILLKGDNNNYEEEISYDEINYIVVGVMYR